MEDNLPTDLSTHKAPHFDRWQFDARMVAKNKHAELRTHLNGSELNGFSLNEPLAGARKVGDWVFNDAKVRVVLSKYRRDGSAARWAGCLYLYYRCGLTSREVAAELGIHQSSVLDILYRLKKRGDNLFNGLGKKANAHLHILKGTADQVPSREPTGVS